MKKTKKMLEFEEKTGKHAIWHDKITKQFKKWEREDRFRIVVDTREQKPYKFKKQVVKKLDIGDYAPLGYEDFCAIERKNFSDWASSITHNRDRFEREIMRAKENLDFFCIIIETDMESIWKEHLFSQVKRSIIVNCIPFWMVKFNIPVVPCSNRSKGKYLVKEICKAYVRYRERDKYKELFEKIYR